METMAVSATADEVATFVHDFYDAFAEQDWDRLATMFVDDYQQIDERRGVWYRGDPLVLLASQRAEIEAAESYQHRIDDLDARLVTEDVGVATYVWYADARWDGVDYHIRCPATTVVRRTPGGWRAVVIHAVEAEDRSGS